MSADNWAICPQCLGRAKDRRTADGKRVEALYGTVSIEEFDAARKALVEVDPEKFRTFREDYEFHGAEDGEVHAAYSGRCAECGLSVGLDASKRFWPPVEH